MNQRPPRFGQFWTARGLAARVLLALVLPAGWLAACSSERVEVVVFEDPGLAPLMAELAARFQRNHPAVLIRLETEPGLAGIRKIAVDGARCDLIAFSDEQVASAFLFPKLARRSYSFLGNQIVLATPRTDLLDNSESQGDWRDHWFEFLFDGSHAYGTVDPETDAEGYFSRMAWKLAEIHYGRQGLYRKLLSRSRQTPRDSQLLELLGSGELDFAFVFQSTALQNNLRFVRLPPEISMGEESYMDGYSQVFLQVRGLSPGSTFEVQGEPIRHGIAPLIQAGETAERFLQFCLSEEAKAVAREMGYSPIATVEVGEGPP